MSPEQDTGDRFLDALLDRDFAGVAAQLHERVLLRALQPGGALVRVGVGPVVDRCQWWFGSWDRITVLDRRTVTVGSRLALTYQLAVGMNGGLCEVAHHMFVDVVDGRITVIDLLDSGFVPVVSRVPATDRRPTENGAVS